MIRTGSAIAAVALTASLAACTGTTYDPAEARPTTPPSTTTTVPTGSTADILSRLSNETQALESVIQTQGDTRSAIATINALWAAVSQRVGRADPQMRASFEGALRLADRAASSHQMGYAIRAGKSVRELVTAFVTAYPTVQ